MRGLPSLWNFTPSEQISFPCILAGRISNMVREQWRYRAKDSWWDELQQHGGMQIQMSESDTKMLLEVGQPLSIASSCKSTSVTWSLQWLLLNGQNSIICLHETVLWKINYDKTQPFKLIMTKPRISIYKITWYFKFLLPFMMQILFSKIWCAHSGADENLSLLHRHCLVVATILKDQGSVLWHVTNHLHSDTA